MDQFDKRHPFIVAQRKFVAGQITVAQAVGMVRTDREFIAECELNGHDTAERAARIVRNLWVPRLIHARQEEKRNNG